MCCIERGIVCTKITSLLVAVVCTRKRCIRVEVDVSYLCIQESVIFQHDASRYDYEL